MTLASSGYISLGGDSPPDRNVNLELGNSASAAVVFPNDTIRTLTGVAGGPLVLPDSFWSTSIIPTDGFRTPARMNGSTTRAYMLSVTYSGGRFVAVGYGGDSNYPLYATSSDGNTWTTPALMNGSTASTFMTSVTSGGSRFVAVGYNIGGYYPVYATSTDGSTWTTPAPMNGSTAIVVPGRISVTYGGGRFVAVGNTVYATSTDGSTWTTPARILDSMNSVTYGSSKFVAVGQVNNGPPLYTISTDGSTWTTPNTMNGYTGYAMMESITYGGGRFVAVGYTGGYTSTEKHPLYATSNDGKTWTTPARMNGSTTYAAMHSVTYDGSTFVAVGYDISFSPLYATSNDGNTWTTPARMNGSTTYAAMQSVTSGRGRFVAVGYDASGYPVYSTTAFTVNFSGGFGVNLYDTAVAAGWDTQGALTFNVTGPIGGVVSNSTSTPHTSALIVDRNYPNGVTIVVSTGTYIIGAGGSGETHRDAYQATGELYNYPGYINQPVYKFNLIPGTTQKNGGHAIETSLSTGHIYIQNYGTIGGGGGGGGSGAGHGQGGVGGIGKVISPRIDAVAETGKQGAGFPGYSLYNGQGGAGAGVTGSVGTNTNGFIGYGGSGGGLGANGGNGASGGGYNGIDGLGHSYSLVGSGCNQPGGTAGDAIVTTSTSISRVVSIFSTGTIYGPKVVGGFTAPTQIGVTTGTNLISVAYGGGKFVAVGFDGSAYPMCSTSTNGISWSQPLSLGITKIYLRSVIYANNKFVAVGYAPVSFGPMYATSTDGITWSTGKMNNSNTTAYMSSVTYGGGKFVAVGYNSTSSPMYATSTDGSTWTTPATIGNTVGFMNITSVTYGGGKFVAVGYNSSFIGMCATSTDGSTWTDPVTIESSMYMQSVTYSGGKFVAVGYTPTALTPMYATSTDGNTWSKGVMNNSTSRVLLTSVTFGKGRFIAIGNYFSSPSQRAGTGFSVSDNGFNWSEPMILNTNGYINSITYSGSKFVGVGYIQTGTTIYSASTVADA